MKPITPEQLAQNGSEDGEQLALMCWAALNFNKYPELTRLAHIPNGGFRNKREAAKLRAMGVKRGVPDLILFVRRDTYSGLVIEMKNKKGKTSKEQEDWLNYLKSQGWGTMVCHNWLEARDILISYLEYKRWSE